MCAGLLEETQPWQTWWEDVTNWLCGWSRQKTLSALYPSLPLTKISKNSRYSGAQSILKLMRFTGVQRLLFLLRSSVDLVIFLRSAPTVLHFLLFCVCFTVPTSCSLHLNHKKKKLSNLQTKTEITLTSLVLNGTFLLKEVQLLSVFCLRFFLTAFLCARECFISLFLLCSYFWMHHKIHLHRIKGQCLFSLQALAEKMDAQNEHLGWLNKHAPQILASPSVNPQSRDQHVGKLRAINLSWSKVSTLYPSSYLSCFTTLWQPQYFLTSLPLCCVTSILFSLIL